MLELVDKMVKDEPPQSGAETAVSTGVDDYTEAGRHEAPTEPALDLEDLLHCGDGSGREGTGGETAPVEPSKLAAVCGSDAEDWGLFSDRADGSSKAASETIKRVGEKRSHPTAFSAAQSVPRGHGTEGPAGADELKAPCLPLSAAPVPHKPLRRCHDPCAASPECSAQSAAAGELRDAELRLEDFF